MNYMKIMQNCDGITFSDEYGHLVFENEREVMAALRAGYDKRNIETYGLDTGNDDVVDAMRYCYNDVLSAHDYVSSINDPNGIDKVIFNDPATIIIWNDGSKTVVKCSKDESFDPEKGLAMAICKKVLGDKFKACFKHFIPEEKPELFTLD